MRCLSVWLIIRLSLSRKTIVRRRIILVLPGRGVLTNSQGLMAKKKAPMMRSTAWSYALACSRLLESDHKRLKSLGVIAFWRCSGGDMLSMARNRAFMDGRNWVPLWSWRGLNWRLSRNAVAKALAALRTVDPTRGSLRCPRSLPDGVH